MLPLPVTEQQFIDLVEQISQDNPDIESKARIAAAVSLAISFLPKDKGTVELETMSSLVRKSISTHFSQYMAQKLGHEATVDQLISELKTDPGNMQARDQLQQAIDSGSLYAKNALAKLEGTLSLVKD